jgi:hypothetical protein
MKKLALVFLILAACADSKSAPPSGNNQQREQKPGTCALAFQKNCATLTWKQRPKSGSVPGSFDLKFEAGNGPYNVDGAVQVIVDMEEMHHPSDVHVTRKIGAAGFPVVGLYQVSNVFMSMNGEWKIEIKIVKDGATVDDVVIPYEL